VAGQGCWRRPGDGAGGPRDRLFRGVGWSVRPDNAAPSNCRAYLTVQPPRVWSRSRSSAGTGSGSAGSKAGVWSKSSAGMLCVGATKSASKSNAGWGGEGCGGLLGGLYGGLRAGSSGVGADHLPEHGVKLARQPLPAAPQPAAKRRRFQPKSRRIPRPPSNRRSSMWPPP
jgi:hypothetical protein